MSRLLTRGEFALGLFCGLGVALVFWLLVEQFQSEQVGDPGIRGAVIGGIIGAFSSLAATALVMSQTSSTLEKDGIDRDRTKCASLLLKLRSFVDTAEKSRRFFLSNDPEVTVQFDHAEPLWKPLENVGEPIEFSLDELTVLLKFNQPELLNSIEDLARASSLLSFLHRRYSDDYYRNIHNHIDQADGLVSGSTKIAEVTLKKSHIAFLADVRRRILDITSKTVPLASSTIEGINAFSRKDLGVGIQFELDPNAPGHSKRSTKTSPFKEAEPRE